MSISSGRVIVVGAGIVGAACAWYLMRDGHQVTIVDRAGVGCGATAAGMGHIVVMDDSPAQMALTRYSRQLWNDMAPQLPASAEFVPSGTLWIADDAEEMAAAEKKAALYKSCDVDAVVLSPAELYAREANLRPGLAGALLVPADSVIYSPCAAAWLVNDVCSQGGILIKNAEVKAVRDDCVELRDGRVLQTDISVIASGTSLAELLPQFPVRARKGHLVITDRAPAFVRHQLVELGYLKSAHATEADSVAFNVQPRATGQLLIGSSRQYQMQSAQVDHGILQAMLNRAFYFMPSLKELGAVRAWAGFRAASPDHLPILGPVAGMAGVYVAGGHEGLGITTSLAGGRLIADMLAGRTSAIDPAPYLPARFAAGSGRERWHHG